MELRNYSKEHSEFTLEQRDGVIDVVRNHVARGQGIDGTFEFHYLDHTSELDRSEYDFILVVDMGLSEEREAQKLEVAKKIGIDLSPILGTDSFAVRLRLQNAAFVPFET